MPTRFKCYIPGWLKMTLLAWRYPRDWRSRMRAVITDTVTGQSFRVTEEEDALLSVAGEAFHGASLHEMSGFPRLAKQSLQVGTDEIFTAMLARRCGDEAPWIELLAMTPEGWRQWWRKRVERQVAKQRTRQ